MIWSIVVVVTPIGRLPSSPSTNAANGYTIN